MKSIENNWNLIFIGNRFKCLPASDSNRRFFSPTVYSDNSGAEDFSTFLGHDRFPRMDPCKVPFRAETHFTVLMEEKLSLQIVETWRVERISSFQLQHKQQTDELTSQRTIMDGISNDRDDNGAD